MQISAQQMMFSKLVNCYMYLCNIISLILSIKILKKLYVWKLCSMILNLRRCGAFQLKYSKSCDGKKEFFTLMRCIRLVLSVGLSHQYKNMPNWYNKAVSTLKAISNIIAQAQKPATDDAMFTLIFSSKFYVQVFWNVLFLIVTSEFCRAFKIKYLRDYAERKEYLNSDPPLGVKNSFFSS